MAKTNSDTDTTIESLLEQRAQYEQWLAKLDSAADKAPPAVRQRVRGDYESRLRGVIERLRGHAATISEELERHQASQADLDSRRREVEEELAEAEVRHTVGEYAEDEWQQLSQEWQGRLQGLREQLRSVGSEIGRLAEVQALIANPPARRPEPAAIPRVETVERHFPPPAPPPPAPEPVVEEAPVQRIAPKPQSRPREPEPSAQQVDELAFLKSVSGEERKPATPSRRISNPGMPTPSHSGSRAVEAPPAPPSQPGSKSSAPGVAKTLKCGECGTLNRPTEWYCERCGAELAGV